MGGTGYATRGRVIGGVGAICGGSSCGCPWSMMDNNGKGIERLRIDCPPWRVARESEATYMLTHHSPTAFTHPPTLPTRTRRLSAGYSVVSGAATSSLYVIRAETTRPVLAIDCKQPPHSHHGHHGDHGQHEQFFLIPARSRHLNQW
jgi:hypothetical protein